MIMICYECGQPVNVHIFGYGEINPECEYCGGYVDPPTTKNQGVKNDDENSFKGNRKKQNKKSLYQYKIQSLENVVGNKKIKITGGAPHEV